MKPSRNENDKVLRTAGIVRLTHHKWEPFRGLRRCTRCALLEEKYTPEPKKTTFSRGGKTVAVLHFKARQPTCRSN